MLTIVFLLFVTLFLISGVFLSLEAKRRRAGHGAISSAQTSGHKTGIHRANSDED